MKRVKDPQALKIANRVSEKLICPCHQNLQGRRVDLSFPNYYLKKIAIEWVQQVGGDFYNLG